MSWKFHTRKLLFSQAVLALVMVFIESGCAVECFVCDSSVNPGCTNLKSNSSIKPEICTLEKMKTINTWLFELNEIAYFKSKLTTNPPMNCQKVVAKRNTNDPDSEFITARFCQLDTRDTDACSILKEKFLSDGSPEKNFKHCSICNTDRCNGTERIHLLSGLGWFAIACLLKIFG